MLVAPGISEFKAQFVRDFPYATPRTLAGQVAATFGPIPFAGVNGALSGVPPILTGGSGYKAAPTIIVLGNGVGGALAATIAAGVVNAVTLVNPGYGYTVQPTLYVSTGEGDNTDEQKVTDYDLATAMLAAQSFNMTTALWGSQSAYTYAYNLLAAHYLCETLIAGGTGLKGKAEWLTNSKTVGNVTESYSIPDRILRSPILSKLSKTTYGSQFLELVAPQLIGNFSTFHRCTLP